MVSTEGSESHAYWNKLLETCLPVKDFLELKNFRGEVTSESSIPLASVSEISKDNEERNGSVDNPLDQYLVPSNLVERWGSAMGILISCRSYTFFLIISCQHI